MTDHVFVVAKHNSIREYTLLPPFLGPIDENGNSVGFHIDLRHAVDPIEIYTPEQVSAVVQSLLGDRAAASVLQQLRAR